MAKSFFAAIVLALATFGGASPALAQGPGNICRLEVMPRLPADAFDLPAQARQGFAFVPGAYRCRIGRWEYVAGHWERARRNAVPDPLTLIDVQEGRLRARPGYEIVQQGTGASTQTVLRRAGVGPGGNAALVNVTITCGCGATGSCQIVKAGNTVYCTSQNCSGSCTMATTSSGSAGIRAERRDDLGTTPCTPAGAGATARR